MTEGKSYSAAGLEVIYQAGYGEDAQLIAEPAIIIRRYESDCFGIIQGDQEIIVGGKKSMLQLAKAIKSWGTI